MTLTYEDVRARDEERRRERKFRTQRVEILGLPACTLCGGATVPVDDQEIACVCDQKRSALQDRLNRLVADHTDPDQRPLVDVIAP